MKKLLLVFFVWLSACTCQRDHADLEPVLIDAAPTIRPLGGLGIGPKIGPAIGPVPRGGAFPRHLMVSELAGSVLQGADGASGADVDGDGDTDFTTAFEQSHTPVFVKNPGCALAKVEPWPSVNLPATVTGIEDARFGDLDNDGRMDVLGSGDQELNVFFGPASNDDLLTAAAWDHEEIAVAAGQQIFIVTLVVDVDNDGQRDIVAGGVGVDGTLDIYRSATPRDGATYTREQIADIGTNYSLEGRDMDGDTDIDIVISDSEGLAGQSATRGVRYYRNPAVGGGVWTNVEIYTSIGNTRWLEVSANGKTIAGGQGPVSGTNFFWILTCAEATPSACNKVGGSAPAWQKTDVVEPANVGQYNAVRLADMDNDGDTDIVYAFHHATGDQSNVVVLLNVGATYARVEASGPLGVKSDNFELSDLDCDGDKDIIVTDEGVRGDPTVQKLGLYWLENLLGWIDMSEFTLDEVSDPDRRREEAGAPSLVARRGARVRLPSVAAGVPSGVHRHC